MQGVRSSLFFFLMLIAVGLVPVISAEQLMNTTDASPVVLSTPVPELPTTTVSPAQPVGGIAVPVPAVPTESIPDTSGADPATGRSPGIEVEADAPQSVMTADGLLSRAPMSPEFLAWQSRQEQSGGPVSRNERAAITLNDGSTTRVFLEGEIPAPLDLSHTRGLQISPGTRSFADGADGFLPTAYDLRTYGRVSPVKDQGGAGSCWAFATVASLESTLLPGESWDFSENNMKNTLASTYPDGFDRACSGGGNRYMSSAYLTRWSGPVRESDDPYNDVSCTSPSGLHTYKHVLDTIYLPVRASLADNGNIKYALMNRGAVQASIYWDSAYFNAGTFSFYNNGALINGVSGPQWDTATTNHAITIVGWNDSYSRTNFATQPAGDGAFIVKNSWGSGWGNSGYFYVSYYDLTIGDKCAVFVGDPAAVYDQVYEYDPLGWINDRGYATSTAQYANVFTAQSDETLNAIGTYENYPGTFTARVYLDPVGGPINASGFVSEATWTDTWLGYKTVDIPDVALRAGQTYSIVIIASTPGYTYPIPTEEPQASYSSHATAGAGQSYVSSTGVTWTDLTTSVTNANVCVKGYTTRNAKIGVFRPSSHLFYLKNGSVTTIVNWGAGTDIPVTGDWNGDGLTDIGVFRPSSHMFYLKNGATTTAINWGLGTDLAVTGDWNGDGLSEPGVFRPSSHLFYLKNGSVTTIVNWGASTDIPVTGDWNGNGLTDIGVFRPSNHMFYLKNGSVTTIVNWGQNTDIPVSGDWNGDGLTDVGVFRPTNHMFYLKNGATTTSINWGLSSDTPITGKWS